MENKRKNKCFFKRTFLIFPLFFILIFQGFLFSCKTTKVQPEEEYIPDESDFVSIPVPDSARSFFGPQNQKALSLVEEGSAENIKAVFSLLHKTNREDYTEKEKILLYTASKISQIAWPLEATSYDAGDFEKDNPYYAAIHSAEMGIYDTSTGNTDFLTYILPSLTILTGGLKDEYISLSQRALESCLKMNEDSTLANYLYGRLLSSLGKNKEALSYFDKALTSSPSCLEIMSAKAICLYEEKKFDQAEGLAEKVLSFQKQNAEMLKIVAQVSYRRGDKEKALSYVLRVLELQSENSEYILFRIKLLLDNEDYIRSSSLLDAYGRGDDKAKDYLLLRARLALEWNKNSSLAASYIGQAVELYPEDTEVLLQAAKIASANNSLVGKRTAIDLASEVLAFESDNVEAIEVCIAEMKKQEAYSDAYDLSKILVEAENVTDSQKRSHISICLTLGYTKEAQTLAQKLYEENPDDEENLKSYIEMLTGTKQNKKALALINSILEKDETKQDMKSFLYYQRSFLSSQDSAVSDLRSSLAANPRNRDTLYRLYQIYFNQGEYKRAQYYLKQLVSLEPTNTTFARLNDNLENILK